MQTVGLILTIIQFISALAIVVVVLFQSGKSAGLTGSIFGGSGDTFLAKNKGKSLDATLAKATKWLSLVFVVLTMVLNFSVFQG